MRGIRQSPVRLSLMASVLLLLTTAGWSQSLTWLGTLGGNQSVATGVSADGSVVVGEARNAAGYRRAFRWTAATGLQDLGTLGGTQSAAYSVSADGSVVVGWAQTHWNLTYHAFRWTLSGGMQDIGTLSGSWAGSVASGVSADGSVVVGWSHNSVWQDRAFRWTAAGGMRDLGALSGGWSWALSVSLDGSVVVGGTGTWSSNTGWQGHSMRWTEAMGMQYLGTLPTYAYSWCIGVSADGMVAVGWASNSNFDDQVKIVPFSGQHRMACRTLARLGGHGVRLMAFLQTAH
jgi:probable HAF family extracellular repeat protein